MYVKSNVHKSSITHVRDSMKQSMWIKISEESNLHISLCSDPCFKVY
jgi:hypothetical protein